MDSIDFSLVWRELFRGRVVSEIHAQRPRLNFVQGKTKETSQLDFDRRWQDVIKDLFPIEITHFEVTRANCTSSRRIGIRRWIFSCAT